MQHFSEQCFPTDIAYGVSGGPRFVTDIVTTSAGIEYRNINFATSRNRYNVASGVKTKEQLDRLLMFFRAMHGRGVGFRFKDWLDYSANAEVIAVGDGRAVQFPLIKTYQVGEVKEQRRITKPVASTIRIYLDNLVTTACHVDPRVGIITFRQPPKLGVVMTADFEFDVPVRFDIDHIAASIDNYGVYSLIDIPLIEILPCED